MPTALRLVRGLAFCTVFWLLGEGIVRAIGLPYGGGLLGFALLAIALRRKWIALATVDEGADLLVRHLGFPLVGVTAGIVLEASSLAGDALPLAIASGIATLVVLVFVGLTAEHLLTRTPR